MTRVVLVALARHQPCPHEVVDLFGDDCYNRGFVGPANGERLRAASRSLTATVAMASFAEHIVSPKGDEGVGAISDPPVARVYARRGQRTIVGKAEAAG